MVHSNITLILQHRFLSKHKSFSFSERVCLYSAHLTAASCSSTWPPSSMAKGKTMKLLGMQFSLPTSYILPSV